MHKQHICPQHIYIVPLSFPHWYIGPVFGIFHHICSHVDWSFSSYTNTPMFMLSAAELMTFRLSADTWRQVLLLLGSYQWLWWGVISRCNTSDGWLTSQNGKSLSDLVTKSWHAQEPMCPWNGEWDQPEKKINCTIQ